MSADYKESSVFNGRKLKVEIFGASHAPEIGVVVKGFNGESVDMEILQTFMDRRRAKKAAQPLAPWVAKKAIRRL